MITLILFAIALLGIAYVAIVVFRIINADNRGGISNVLTYSTLFKMSLSFLAVCITSGAIFLGGSASGISGSGGSAENQQFLEAASHISEFCLYASLTLAVAALISYAYNKKICR
ncbi:MULTISPECIES: hypothetical protein [Pseudomonas]|uniref:hypothetical protein n=1 Tax=Pseudomonas TaxID=286 RepID=UPI0012AF77C1|nr:MULTISPECIES: hypothetical protein [Pseudomonas]MBP1119805.1 hypothetical protein [Pseudomonas sp. PvP028]MBS7418338.1 hypothetical protein [Pseudomonas syringae]QWB05482.1 hypothetical protein KLC09_17735 [Pseudomonas syringae]